MHFVVEVSVVSVTPILISRRFTTPWQIISPDKLGTDCLEGIKYNKNKNAPAMIKPALTSRDLCVILDFSEYIGEGVGELAVGGTEIGEDRFRECDERTED